MGTEIYLTVAGISISWSKNEIGLDHGVLFQPGDRTRRKSDQIDYDYYAENPDDDGLAAHEGVFARQLGRVLPRLDMLGYTLESARTEFNALVNGEEVQDDSPPTPIMTFDAFCEFACRWPLTQLRQEVDHDDRAKHSARFPDDGNVLGGIPGLFDSDFYWSEASYYGATTCILSAYAMLQVFGTLPANLNAEVVWEYGPLVDSGWVSEDAFQPGVRRGQQILVATEGTSDARIIKHALDLLRPEVNDFFRFIDVDEAHPFPGTGNIFNFAKGLVSIDVQNKILFLLDNDAEGLDTVRKLERLTMPPNMQAMLLPDLEDLRAFPARGPEGITASDINGRAAAIECYLDLRLKGRPPAQILWTNYKKEIEAWQGALEHKTTYVEPFLNLNVEDFRDTGYDMSKIEAVVSALIGQAKRLAPSWISGE